MAMNTSIISKSKLLIYSNKKWITLKSVLLIDYHEMKDILSKIKYFIEKPNIIFSFLFQNMKLVLIYGYFDSDKAITEKIVNSFSSKLFNQSTYYKSIKELSGYSIHSLLFGGLKQITKDSFQYYEQFGHQYYCKAYKFMTLTIANSNLEEIIRVFSKQRLIITFSSIRDLSLFNVSLFFLGSSKNKIIESVKIVKQKLIEIPNINGQLVSFQKRELRGSPIKSMSGLNNHHIKLNSMFKWLSNLKTLENTNNFVSYRKIVNLRKFKSKSSDFLNQKVKPRNKTRNRLIEKTPIRSIFSIFESNNWNIFDDFSTVNFDIIKLANQGLILVLVLSDRVINISEHDLTCFYSVGINLVFISSGSKLIYSHNQIID